MPEPFDQEVYRAILDSLPNGVYVVDPARKIVFWNAGAERITGYSSMEVVGRYCHKDILEHCDANEVDLCGGACPLAQTMLDGKPREVDVFLRHKEGERIPVRVHAAPVRDAAGVLIGAAESFEERVLAAPETHREGGARDTLDSLTGVAGREAIEVYLNDHLADFAQNRMPFAVLAVAVDHLEEIRRIRGAGAVELALRVTAQTLLKSLRPADRIGRWTPDRFLILLAHCSRHAAVEIAESVRRIVGQTSIHWWGDLVPITITVGGTVVRDEESLESMLSRSEEALSSGLAAGGDGMAIL